MERTQLLLYAVTNGGENLPKQVEAALRGGATMIQLREKRRGDAELLRSAQAVKRVTDAYGAALILNDRADLARELGCAGAHLGALDGDLTQARALLGGAILGATARSVEQALAAEAAGADYIGSGAVFGTNTKLDASPMPLERFRAICGAVRIPVVAIGGISAENILRLKGCGMAGFALVSAVFGAADIEAAARRLHRLALQTIEDSAKA
ncbi:MAG: thiamine phosphate synthase [Oscillospiraceae bacterium]|jgi:thiamine-phosphate pyrophosphorylase|nr:thiamine phosphate synthase [Oscillospiraceae bacterium]